MIARLVLPLGLSLLSSWGMALVALADVAGTEAPDLSARLIAWDGIGVLVYRSNFTIEVTKQQVADIFPGEITGAAKVPGLDEQDGKAVVGTLPPLSAVAYLSLSQGLSVASDCVAVRLLLIHKVELECPTVKDSHYPLRRPVLLLSKKEPHPLAEAFSQFVLSPAGQQLTAETYIPIKEK